MEKAIEEAKKGMKRGHGGPFGAVLVKDGKILAFDHNRVLKKNDSTYHAEINVIRKASKKLKRFDLSDCEIYTTGKPCKMCEGAINWAKIKKVYYGNSYKDALNMGFDDEKGNNQDVIYERIESTQTAKLIEEWNNFSKKSIY
ncbi:MAG TPA: nucleoside deaminase [Candidatus Dojkabacteria bacterium]|nr:nucleoside deaminase [Candidatus Dojkabacteria bacterium]